MNGSSFVPLSSSSATSNGTSSASAAAVGSSNSRTNGGNPDLILPFSGHPHPFTVNPQLNNGWGAAFIAAALGGAGINNNSNIMSSASHPSNAAAADAIAALSALTAATAASAAAAAAASAATTNHLAMSSSSSTKVAADGNNNSVIDTCRRCGATGCDVRIEHNSSSGSSKETTGEAGGCLLHTRCCPPPEAPLAGCPVCRESLRCIRLLPMAFEEIDQARLRQQQQQQQKDNRKRKQGKDGEEPDDCDDDNNNNNNNLDRKRKASTLSAADSATAATTAPGTGESPDLRTGRWTPEETSYCDQLIHLFEAGQLPIPDGLKLNDFLSGMLRSKQARLTKKMKNAKLSSRQYRRTSGYITDAEEAVRFSLLEAGFLQSLRCDVERSEMRFHMQKEWRELFSTYCVNTGIKLDAGLWLSSVEEMDRRASRLKDAARMQRRKEMMGYALSQDHQNPQRGVFIDPNTHPAMGGSHGGGPVGAVPMGGVPLTIHHPQQQPSEAAPEIEAAEKRRKLSRTSSSASISSMKPRPLASYSSPFIGKVIHFLQRRNMPFEHVDAWVPSLVPTSEVAVGGSSGPPSVQQGSANTVTRLCFAGCATADVRLPENGAGPSQPMSVDDQFDLISFGLYSQKFSFDVGCGLPGRVYQSGIPSWEQGIANAPTNLFERASGAGQWGIQTVLGLPIFSPNVGRIVVLFYSCFDRPRDDQVVARIIDELTKMMPSPQWKLVVDVGLPPEPAATAEETTESHEARLLRRELLSLIQFHTPADKSSPLAEFLPGFSSLRLLLSSDMSESERERDLLKAALGYFQSYRSAGVSDKDAVWMTARDFMMVSKHASSGSVAGFSMPASRQQASRPFIHQGSRAQPDDIVRAPGGFQQGGGISSRFPVSLAEQQARRGAAGSTSHLPHKGLVQSIDSDQLSASLSLLQSAQAQAPAQGDSGLTLASGMMDMPLGLSPALHPIVAGDMNFDAMSNLALGLSANQLAAFLQSDSFQLNDNSGPQ